MGRGPKPAKGKAGLAASRQSPNSAGTKVRDLEKRLAETVEQLRAHSKPSLDMSSCIGTDGDRR